MTGVSVKDQASLMSFESVSAALSRLTASNAILTTANFHRLFYVHNFPVKKISQSHRHTPIANDCFDFD